MGRILVMENLSLDGVMQSPGRPDEDTRDGFDQGGWFQQYNDEVLGRFLGQNMGSSSGALLLGRRTYEDFAGFWPKQADGNPFTAALDAATKYVASTTLAEPLPWQNSVLLRGDVAVAVGDLKRDTDLMVLGSGELVRTLAGAGLVDEYLLLVVPRLLGQGRRLFDGDARAVLRLTECVPTTTGVLITRYRAAT
ncbi:MAG TPA: dihydrofolate reductase family protein [Mycobacteriales bacterium]|nr:dihydrofolate reductase family protein [Mycobacteriales bacterium]